VSDGRGAADAPASRTITLHLVRHGQTAWNAERRFQTPDVPLSDLGREQARAIAETLAQTTRPGALLASDYARAWETAQIIGGRLQLAPAPEPLLRERNFGIARGRLYAEIGEETLALWRHPHTRIEGGESWADVFERARALMERLRATPPADELVLVSHGGTISIMLALLEGRGVDDFAVAPLDNCALRTIGLAIATPR